MKLRSRRVLLYLRVFWELLRYELVLAIAGFPGVYRGLTRRLEPSTGERGLESEVCRAVDIVSSCYWKRVLCLQRSVVTARVMHAHGIGAEVVIGYGFAPFVSHAWVEVGGRIVNDLAGYPATMKILDRIRPETTASQYVLQA